MKIYFILIFFFLVTSCESIFFFPSDKMVLSPKDLGLSYKSHYLEVGRNEKIHLWELISSSERKGSVVFFHGNAENISTHIGAVAWLVPEGYRVYLLDYRGFGSSDGRPGVRNSLEDIRATLDWVNDKRRKEGDNLPLILFGQSIGASLSLHVMKDSEYQDNFNLLVFDSPFYSYRAIARDKVRETIILYPLAWPISLFLTSCCDPLEGAKEIRKPVIILHSKNDNVVGVRHSEKVYKNIPSTEKELWISDSVGHISFLISEENRLKLLTFFNELFHGKR